ncbi:hypothetical protein IP88_09890 [alpha proteobacterium AAP81b]|nr:hypothetical protein IP88_09890 [alpha proteobacterium AAP81b]
MRAVATLLLAAMAGLFVVATINAGGHPAWPWVQAFAEAALVGGLADWFAVTALFRHPLGLPIPHTAIIPRSKDRIGDTLAAFLKDNFLTPAVVTRRLEGIDMAGMAAEWATRPPAPAADATVSAVRRRGFGPLLARLIEALDTPAMAALVRDTATDKLQALPLSPILADAIDSTLARGRHEPLIDAGLDWALKTLDSQEPVIRGMVSDRTTWVLRLVNIDDRVADQLIAGIGRLLREMRHDPHHSLRARIGESLATWAFDLRHFPENQAQVEAWKADLIANPALAAWLDGLWGEARSGLARALASTGPDSRLAAVVRALGERLAADERLRAAINLHLRRAAVGLVHDYGDEIVSLVSDTIRGWSAATVTDRLETAVGRDLQFIRINGTLIGGLIGLGIHAVTVSL